ncbi:MBL fold metallo-hydrolase [uncultured Ralstonia sp.]|jgi:L-ascorbate metabolism protein UlaG (beta-lactamase superfamily)|uniref:MBL fold metallo-hydrolase n=1 Tax=Ralstonia sp. TaxID=54061 RepID=UPI0025FF8CE4|nr:MBL fold metallo-hydrolase [uncultured Ralstonia sp.]
MKNRHYSSAKPHHTPDGFRNRYPHAREGGNFWQWQRDRRRLGLPKPPTADLSCVAPNLAAIHQPPDVPQLTWIGHETLLLQIDGLNVLTDPVFSERASPFRFAGPRRHQPPGLSLKQLPHIDLVLISHNHYDHLDFASVRALMRQPGGAPTFFVPLGIDHWFARNIRGTRLHGEHANVRAFDWDDEASFGPFTAHFCAVQHWSARGLTDRNQTLWGSWALLHPRLRFWFSGDLGYSQDTRDIGARFGHFDVAAIAVGAYEPRWFMKTQHIDPAEAVQVMLDVGARQSVGIHWGTFPLTDEPLDQPITDLAMALQAHDIPQERFTLLRHGETRVWDADAARLVTALPNEKARPREDSLAAQ